MITSGDSASSAVTVRAMEAADLASLGNEQLLKRRISKLDLKLEGTALEPVIKQLYDELTAKGLVFHPPCYVGDEWLVPTASRHLQPFFSCNPSPALSIIAADSMYRKRLTMHTESRVRGIKERVARRVTDEACFGETPKPTREVRAGLALRALPRVISSFPDDILRENGSDRLGFR